MAGATKQPPFEARRPLGWNAWRAVADCVTLYDWLRTLVPIVCGATGMSPSRFLLWNAVGAAIWAAAFGSIGYLGGHVLSLLLDDLRRHEVAIASGAAILVGGLVLWRTYGRELFDAWSLRRSAAPR